MLIPGYYSGHVIGLRPTEAVSDADLLDRLGLPSYRLEIELPRWPVRRPVQTGEGTANAMTAAQMAAVWGNPKAVIAVLGGWKVLADDQSYTLWNRPGTRPALAVLAKAAEVFTGFLGDCDDTFGFSYYRDGRLVRSYLAEAVAGRPDTVYENVGEPLPGETDVAKPTEGFVILRRVAGVAASLGIQAGPGDCPVRVYRTPAKHAEEPRS